MKLIIMAAIGATLCLGSVPTPAAAFVGGHDRNAGYAMRAHAPCRQARDFDGHGRRFHRAPRRWAFTSHWGQYGHRRHQWNRHRSSCDHHGCDKPRRQHRHRH